MAEMEELSTDEFFKKVQILGKQILSEIYGSSADVMISLYNYSVNNDGDSDWKPMPYVKGGRVFVATDSMIKAFDNQFVNILLPSNLSFKDLKPHQYKDISVEISPFALQMMQDYPSSVHSSYREKKRMDFISDNSFDKIYSQSKSNFNDMYSKSRGNLDEIVSEMRSSFNKKY